MKVSIFAIGILFACVFAAQAQDDFLASLRDSKSDLKDTLTGLATSAGGSVNVDNIIGCGFNTIADALIGGIKDVVTDASACNPLKISDIQNKIKALLVNIPQSIGSCVQTNKDAQTLLSGLKVNGKTPDQIVSQVVSWITSNPITACLNLQNLYASTSKGNMKQFGIDGGKILITIFGSSKKLEFFSLGASKDHIGQILTGISTNVQEKVDVTQITACADESAFASLEAALLPVIDEAASCDPTKVDDIASKITTVVNSLPADAKTCVTQGTEGPKILKGLGILGLTPDQIKTKVTGYVLSHILTVCGSLDSLNKKLKGGDFNGFGTDIGKLALDVFKNSDKLFEEDFLAILFASLGASKDRIGQVLTGISTNVQEKVDVTQITACADESTFASLESALLPVIDEAASCDPTKMNDIASKITTVVNSLPASAKTCINKGTEGPKLFKGLGILGLTTDQIKTKVAGYVLSHVSAVCSSFGSLNKKLKGGDFKGFGTDLGKLAIDVFKNSNKKLAQDVVFALMAADKLTVKANLDNFADLLGGIASATSAKGADTKTTAKCTDEPTSTTLLTNIAALTKSGSTCDLTKAAEIATKAKALVDGIPASHKTCLNSDPAAKAIATALGISGAGIDKITAKALAYAIGHFTEVCNTVKVLDASSSSAKWNQYGTDAGKLLVKMFA